MLRFACRCRKGAFGGERVLGWSAGENVDLRLWRGERKEQRMANTESKSESESKGESESKSDSGRESMSDSGSESKSESVSEGVNQKRRERRSGAKASSERNWSSVEVQREFMEGLRRELSIDRLEDWKEVTTTTVLERGGQGLLQRYGSSVHRILEEVVYKRRLDPLDCRKRVPNGYWKSVENRRAFLERLAKAKGLKERSDWKNVTLEDVREMGGGGLLQLYNSSIHRALEEAYGKEEAEAMRSSKPHGHWRDPLKRREFLDALAVEFSVKRPEDWARVSVKDFHERGAASLLLLHRNSVLDLLRATYPELQFHPLRCRPSAPRGYWTSLKNRRAFMDDVAKRFNVEKAEDWTQVKTKHIEDMGGSGLLAKHNGSLFSTLKETYPELDLDEATCRDVKPNYYWEDASNRRLFLEKFAARHGVKTADDWRAVTWETVRDEGGHALLKRYTNLFEAIRDLFPEYGLTDDDVLRCRRQAPPGHWEKHENVVFALKQAGAKLGITKKEDWYRVSVAQLNEAGCGGLFKQTKLVDALRLAFPEEEWNEGELVNRSKRSMQRQMVRCVERMFPHLEMQEDFKHSALGQQHEVAGREYLLELDLYLPGHEIGFEYNGAHHYRDVGFYGPVDMYKKRDEAKRRLCKDRGIRMVEVPYWWNGKVESFAATLYEQLPSFVATELIRGQESDSGSSQRTEGGTSETCGLELDRKQLLVELERGEHRPIISLEDHMAEDRKKAQNSVAVRAARKGARVWRPGDHDVKGMLMTEALEGVRVHWNAKDAALSTEKGKRVTTAPQWWTDRLPLHYDVDGVLYMGKSSMGSLISAAFLGQRALAVTNSMVDPLRDSTWRAISFVAHDMVPSDAAMGLAERVEQLRELPQSSTFVVASYERCEGTEELLARLESDVGQGGGGFVLRSSSAPYAYGKQAKAELRALKTFTAEVRFVAKNSSSRSFACRSSSGILQAVQVSKWEYQEPPAPGTALRVQHFGTRINSGRLKWPYIFPDDV